MQEDLISCDLLINMITWLINYTYVNWKCSFGKLEFPWELTVLHTWLKFISLCLWVEFLNFTLKEKDFSTLHKFTKCHRYIDDLLAVNNDGILEDYKGRIYPPELKLSSEDKNDQEVTYLDLQLKIEKTSINYKLYDKRDNFGFSIVNFPDLSGNVPTSQSYGGFSLN